MPLPAPKDRLLAVYRAMRTAREVDIIEVELAKAGEGFFQIGGTGHESVAAIDLFLKPADWVHPHYRSKSLTTIRGISPKAWFDSFLANAESYSAGRQMASFMCSAEYRLPSACVLVGNSALQCCGIAAEELRKGCPNQEIVVCGLGDGATQQGEVLEAFAEAAREQLPVLFLIEDNAAAISTLTEGRTPYSLCGEQASILGLPVLRLDGRRIYGELEKLGQLVDRVRTGRPAILVLRLERLCSHSSSDDEKVYRPESLRQQLAAAGDALGHFRAELITAGAASAAELDVLDAAIAAECRAAAETSRRVPDSPPSFDCKSPLPTAAAPGSVNEYLGVGEESRRSLTMLEAMRGVLRARLFGDPRVSLYGQDIEDPKGDVFGVTRGLSTEFPGRVRNSPLSEATIVGRAVGQAIAGGKPVGFIQFGDFLTVGINQVMSEMGSLFWRSGGQFRCPVILMVTCGGYRPGLGPFHAQTLEGILAHIPGIDVMMPSNAADAAALLNAAFDSGRPTVFLYPKALLNDRMPRQLTSSDIGDHRCAVGTARIAHGGNDLTLVAWGSTVPLAVGVAERLAKENKGVEVLDLRCLSPWDRDAVLASARRTGRVLVTHEDNLTGGFGAEVLATVAEQLPGTHVARVARADTWIPFNFPNQLEVLPSFRRLLSECARLLDLSATWPAPVASSEPVDMETLTAQGISPADDQVSVIRWLVKPGQTVRIGEHIADMETDKAAYALAASHGGQVREILLDVDIKVPVGTPILRLRKQFAAASVAEVVRRPTREDWGRPVISSLRAAMPAAVATAAAASDTLPVEVYLSGIEYVEGRMRLTNSMLEQRFPGRSGEDIVRMTGIQSRPMLAPDQTVVSIGVEAARKALKAQGLSVKDLTGIVCHSTTPPFNTPSMACLILRELDPEGASEMMVHDCNAACSGWLYALDMAWHTIRHQPGKVVLVVTTEALSHVVNPTDYDTAILFGDAATATIVRGTTEGRYLDGGLHLVLHRPVLSGKSDASDALTVGFRGQGHVHMDGKKVFAEATRAMTKMTRRALAESGLTLAQLDWLVPHQANRRIMEAVRGRLGLPREKVIDMTDVHGNTSSSSIPLSIAKSRGKFIRGQKIGVCAFGGGFTFGAAVLEVK